MDDNYSIDKSFNVFEHEIIPNFLDADAGYVGTVRHQKNNKNKVGIQFEYTTEDNRDAATAIFCLGPKMAMGMGLDIAIHGLKTFIKRKLKFK